jgi:hypothetical protein
VKIHRAQVLGGTLVPLSGSELESLLRDREGQIVDVGLGSRSLSRHHLLMAYAEWLFTDYFSDRFSTFHVWRKEWSKEIGWTESHTFINKMGEKVEEVEARTWSPDKLTAADHKRLVEIVSEQGQMVSGIGIDEFHQKRVQFVEGRA